MQSLDPNHVDRYLFKTTDVAAEYLSAGMGLDQDLPLLLGLCGKIQPAFHRLAPVKQSKTSNGSLNQLKNCVARVCSSYCTSPSLAS